MSKSSAAVLQDFGGISLDEIFSRKMRLRSCEAVSAGLKSRAQHPERCKIQ